MTGRKKRAALDALRAVCAGEGWAVVAVFAEASVREGPDDRAEWRRVQDLITSGNADMVVVPSLTAMGDGVSSVLQVILWLQEQRCDLYVHDAGLNTASPVDKVLFKIAEALKVVDDAAVPPPPKAGSKRPQPKHSALLPYQISVIRAGLKSGLSVGEMAKSLKLPVTTVRAAAKRLDA